MRAITFGHVLVLSMSTLVGGCVIDSSDGTAPNPDDMGLVPQPDDSTTRGHLSHVRKLTVQPGGIANITATRLWGEDYVVDAAIPFIGGEVSVQAQKDGRLTVVGAELRVGNVQLSKESVPPNGLLLTDVVLRLPYVTSDAKWTADGSAALVETRTELTLDWSLESNPGEVHPMATQYIREVPVSLDVVAGKDGVLHLVLHATRDGIFFTWTGLFELSDLVLDIEAVE